MASEGYHEPVEYLTDATRDMHRAIQSLIEELQAVTWYAQRMDATPDAELRAVLAHNRDEEKEHAAMLLEWIRRRDPSWEEKLRTYLFTESPLTGIEAAAQARDGEGADSSVAPAAEGGAPAPGHLTVGSLMGKR